jgi:hypothetical protein
MNSTCNRASVTLGRRSSRCSDAQSGTARALAATAFGHSCLELSVAQTLDDHCVEPDRSGASKSPRNLTDADAERLHHLAMAAPQRDLLTKSLSQLMLLEPLSPCPRVWAGAAGETR